MEKKKKGCALPAQPVHFNLLCDGKFVCHNFNFANLTSRGPDFFLSSVAFLSISTGGAFSPFDHNKIALPL